MAEQLIAEQSHPSVAEVAQEHDALTLHGIYDNSSVTSNSLIMIEHSSFRTKLEVCLAFEPLISTSLLSPANPDRRTAYAAGLIIVGGDIEAVFNHDGGTEATGLHTRKYNALQNRTIEQIVESQGENYNEAVVSKPLYGGLFWRPSQEYARKATTIPQYLIDAAAEFDLPIYIIDDEAKPHLVTVYDEEGNYELGEAVKPTDIPPIESELNQEELQESLLARGVFVAAERHRRLISSSEMGRLAYVAESALPADLLEEGESESFKTSGSGVSLKIDLHKEDDRLILERRDDQSSEGKGLIKRKNGVTDLKEHISRMLYLPRFPWIGGEWKFEEFGVPTFTESQDPSNDYLDIVERLIESAHQLIAASDTEGPVLFGGKEITFAELASAFLEETGFTLYGYAEEADQHGDTVRATKAKQMAESLVDQEEYDKLREQRLGKDGGFRLTRADVELELI